MRKKSRRSTIGRICIIFYPRLVLAIGYCRCQRLFVCVCVSLCINHVLVHAITRDRFKLGSPNLDQRCKRTWLRSLLFLGAVGLTFKVKFNLKVRIYPLLGWSSPKLITHSSYDYQIWKYIATISPPESHEYIDCFIGLTASWSPLSSHTYIPKPFHGPDCYTVPIRCTYTDLGSQGYFGVQRRSCLIDDNRYHVAHTWPGLEGNSFC